MTFASYGLAIAGLIAIAIPILIHLLWRQRRTPIRWAAMRFLIEAYRRHRRRLQLEQLLLLAVRCLVLILLGLALARPLLERSGLLDPGGSRTVFLVIDNGLASQLQEHPGEKALDGHVARALEVVESLGAGDRVGLITAARPARALLVPPSSDRAAVAALLGSLKPSSAPTDLPGALDLLRAALERVEDHQAFAYLLSDFRAGSAPLEHALPAALTDLGDQVALLAAPAASVPLPNSQISAIDMARGIILAGSGDGSGQLTVRLTRHGGELGSEEASLRLTGDGFTRVEPRTVAWEPGQSGAGVEFILDYTAQQERQSSVTAIIADDRLGADNQRYAVLEVRRQIRVVLIDRRSFGFEPTLDRLTAGQWIHRALEPSQHSPIEVVDVEPAALDVADLRTADVAVLPRPDLLTDAGWTMLRRYVDSGGLLIISPPAGVNVHQWTDHVQRDLGLPWALRREVTEYPDGLPMDGDQPRTALLHMLSGDLDELTRPVVTVRTLPVETPSDGGEIILQLADGTPLILAGTPQQVLSAAGDEPAPEATAAPSRGLVIYLASAPQLDWTNLPSKPLMVPLYHEMIRQGLSIIRAARPVYVGDRPALPVGPAAAAVVGPDGSSIALDDLRRPAQAFQEAGLYRVLDIAGQPVGKIAVNVDPAAGRTQTQSPNAVKSWLARSGPWEPFDGDDVSAALRRAESGSPLAGFLLLLVLLLVVVETLLARWFSHAWRAGAGGAPGGLRPSIDEHVAAGAGGAS